MTQTIFAEGTVARTVLALQSSETTAFIREKVGERVFSSMIAELNRDVLEGSADQRDQARRALSRLGFAET